MNMNRWTLLLWAWGAVALPACARAQAAGESAETGPTAAPATVSAAAIARSPLWQAVESAFRQRDAVPVPVVDRRLNAEQRQQLREQIRRAAPRGERRGVAEVTQLEPR